MKEFRHKILNFNPQGILTQLGVTPLDGASYFTLLPQVTTLIEAEALIVAGRLNKQLRESYKKDMLDIGEFRRYPAYLEVMDKALSHSRNKGFYWDEHGTIQVKFVDTDGLGDLSDLQAIQKMVHPGGTLEGWIVIYNNWLNGRSKTYEETVDARLRIMSSMIKAPFWEIIELGNGYYAYPRVEGKGTLHAFEAVYEVEMKAFYSRILLLARGLITKSSLLFEKYQVITVVFRNQLFPGHSWIAHSGKIMFSIAGEEGIDALGHPIGRGFILDEDGTVIKEWHGWLPF
jgi:hypothetical protein